MSSRITSPDALPNWFDTKKYDAAIHLDARGWYEQIVVRRQCFSMVWNATIGDDDLEVDSKYGIKPSALLSAVRSKPIFDFFGSHFQQSINREIDPWSVDFPPSETSPPGIRGLSALDVANLIQRLPGQMRNEFLEWLDEKLDHDSSGLHVIKCSAEDPEWLLKPLGGLGSHPVKIDPLLPDNLLSDCFDLYLKHNLPAPGYSSSAGESDPFSLKGKPTRSNLYFEWYNCGLLQYMDLKTWSLETDTTITNKALAKGIFPNNSEKGEENIRTTTKNHSERILNEGVDVSAYIDTLKAYAELEDFLARQS